MSKAKKGQSLCFADLTVQAQEKALVNDAKVLYSTAMQAYHILGVYQQLSSAHHNHHPTFQQCGCFWRATLQSMHYTMQMYLAKLYDKPEKDTITLFQLLNNLEIHQQIATLSLHQQTCCITLTEKEKTYFEEYYARHNTTAPVAYANGCDYRYYLDTVDAYLNVLRAKRCCVTTLSKTLHIKRNQFLAHHIRATYDDVNSFLQACTISIDEIEYLVNVAISIATGIHQLLTGKGLSTKISNHNDVRYILSVLNTPLDGVQLGDDCCTCKRF